ncbi:MAG: type III pantothenate kinase, partial [Hungatella sp.]
MILALDMGNTNIVVGGIDDERTYFVERITTNAEKTDLEYAVSIKNILEIHQIERTQIEGAILASVVPPLNTTLLSAIEKICGFRPMLVGSGMKTGLNILMDNPKTVGSDLIVDSVAALNAYPCPIIIMDMGTATTMCVIDPSGNYIGGVILPGLKVSLNS